MTANIAIILPVYNGEKYLVQQINSILNQSDVNPIIYIKDDSSYDSSLEIIRKLSVEHENIKMLESCNKQVNASTAFYEMIINIPLDNHDYFSFCDQDDVWKYNKLKQAVKCMEHGNIHGYSSNVLAFWPTNKKKKVIKSYSQKKYDYMFESAGPGCTFVIKRDLFINIRKFIIENKKEVYKFSSYDWFIYAYARTYNYNWLIDKRFTMNYRQHEHNEKGAHIGFNATANRIRNIRSGWYAQEIWKLAKIFNHSEKLKRLIKSPLNFFNFRRNNFDAIVLYFSYTLGYLSFYKKIDQKYQK